MNYLALTVIIFIAISCNRQESYIPSGALGEKSSSVPKLESKSNTSGSNPVISYYVDRYFNNQKNSRSYFSKHDIIISKVFFQNESIVDSVYFSYKAGNLDSVELYSNLEGVYKKQNKFLADFYRGEATQSLGCTLPMLKDFKLVTSDLIKICGMRSSLLQDGSKVEDHKEIILIEDGQFINFNNLNAVFLNPPIYLQGFFLNEKIQKIHININKNHLTELVFTYKKGSVRRKYFYAVEDLKKIVTVTHIDGQNDVEEVETFKTVNI